MKNNLKFIVTGTGRSGSVYAAKLLTQLDIPCGHECIFNWEPFDQILLKLYNSNLRKVSHCSVHDLTKIVDEPPELEKWVDEQQTIAESSYMAAPYLMLHELKDVKIIHIVRNPIKVISSFIKSLNYFKESNPTNDWEIKIYNNLPELKNIPTQIERACYYYCNWNDLIKNNSKNNKYILCKLENIDKNEKFYNFIEKEKKEIQISKKTNTINERNENLKISDIPSGSIKNEFYSKCSEYNYM